MSAFTLDAARSITAETTDAKVVSLYTEAIVKGDQWSARAAHIVHFRALATSAKAVAATLGKSEQAVSRDRRQVKAWIATGLSDAALADKRRPWQAVTSADFWLAKWGTDEGKALLTAIQAAEGDEAKMALLFGEVLPGRAPKAEATPIAALLALLARAEDASGAEGLVVSDDDRAIIAATLATIAERTGAEVKASVNA